MASKTQSKTNQKWPKNHPNNYQQGCCFAQKKKTAKKPSDITPTYVDSIFIRETVSDITFVRSIRQKGADSHPTPTPPPTSGAKKPVGRKIVRHQSDIRPTYGPTYVQASPHPASNPTSRPTSNPTSKSRHQKADINQCRKHWVFFSAQHSSRI